MQLFLAIDDPCDAVTMKRSDCDASLSLAQVTGGIWRVKINEAQHKSGGFANPKKGWIKSAASAIGEMLGIVTVKLFFQLKRGETMTEWPSEDGRFELTLDAESVILIANPEQIDDAARRLFVWCGQTGTSESEHIAYGVSCLGDNRPLCKYPEHAIHILWNRSATSVDEQYPAEWILSQLCNEQQPADFSKLSELDINPLHLFEELRHKKKLEVCELLKRGK